MGKIFARGERSGWVLGLAFLVLVGCVGGGPREMLDTAELEEMQQNVEHATKIYRRIIDEYPDAPEARTARTRLKALGVP